MTYSLASVVDVMMSLATTPTDALPPCIPVIPVTTPPSWMRTWARAAAAAGSAAHVGSARACAARAAALQEHRKIGTQAQAQAQAKKHTHIHMCTWCGAEVRGSIAQPHQRLPSVPNACGDAALLLLLLLLLC